MYPTTAVSYGQTSDAVKQLQQYLISKGYAIPAGATGYFGDQTKTALSQWQSANGIASTTAGYGTDWGPKSIAAASGTSASSGTQIGTYQGQPIYSGTDAEIQAQMTKISGGTTTSTSAPSGTDYQVGYTTVNNSNPNAVITYTYQGNGQWSVSDTAHGAWPSTVPTSQLVASGTIAAAQTTPATNTSGLDSVLADPSLSADQKTAIQNIYDAVSTNDADRAERIKAAMAAATTYSDPYFKAQILLATDALDRGLHAKDGDLAFSEGQLRASLEKLTGDTSASKDQLSFEHAQELKQLQTKLETDLSTTQDNMAAAGFTSSSKRARAEQLLNDQNAGLVESSNKTFGYQTGNLDRTLQNADVSTQAQLANLERLNSENKLDLYRSTEASVGSDNLPAVDGLTPLGGVGGDIPYKQATDALSFASNFVN